MILTIILAAEQAPLVGTPTHRSVLAVGDRGCEINTATHPFSFLIIKVTHSLDNALLLVLMCRFV